MMNKLLTIVIALSLAIGCNNESKKTNDTIEAKKISLEELVSSNEELNNEMITVSGMVDHVCRHGGQKMFISDKSGEIRVLIRVTESIPEFDIALEGSDVEVTGKLIASVISPMEEDLMGEGNHEGSGDKEGEDCASEEDSTVAEEQDACTTNITYHIEAVSFAELTIE